MFQKRARCLANFSEGCSLPDEMLVLLRLYVFFHYTALHFATKKGSAEVVDILLKHGAKPDVFDVVKSEVHNMYTTPVGCILYGIVAWLALNLS